MSALLQCCTCDVICRNSRREPEDAQVSLELRANLKASMQVQARPPGLRTAIRKSFRGLWHISGAYLMLRNNHRNARGFTRCQLLFGRLVCTWWKNPLVLQRQ